MSRALSLWLAILCLFVGASIVYVGFRMSRESSWGSTAVEDAGAETKFTALKRGEFTLTDQHGEKFNSSSLDGKVWLANFFFSSCAGQCPAQSRQLALLNIDFADRGLEIVSITCDPRNDNPTKLLEYSKRYSASDNWHFLTDSDFDYIKRIANEYFLAPLEQLTHADQIYLFGRDGQLIKKYGVIDAKTYREMKADIEAALEQSTSTADLEESIDEESGDNESAGATAAQIETPATS